MFHMLTKREVKTMVRTFKSLKRARAYAKKTGGEVANYRPGYTNRRKGHLYVRRKRS